MVELHFQDSLTKEKIEEIRNEHEFRESLPIEQFIMDFEALYHIQKRLSDCVVKGGMAVPFHLNDKSFRRLSVDIDMVTGQSRETVIETMKEIVKDLEGMIEIPSNHIPEKKSNKELPLLTYYCNYNSSVEERPRIKIEIFYDNQLQIKTKRITEHEEIIGFHIDFPLSIFDHGALIGDKLTTLPFVTIGLDEGRVRDIPKQIYDIAHLLKSISNEIPIQEIIETFEIVSREEISYYVENPPTLDEILEDLIVLGHAVPQEHRDLRKSICMMGYSPTQGLVRLYPVPINVRPKRWEMLKLPVEKSSSDTRSESWKIEGAKNEFNILFKKIHHFDKVKPKNKGNIIDLLLSKYQKDCISSLNDKKESLGIIKPENIEAYFEKRKDFDPNVQSTLDSDTLYKTSSNFEFQPRIKYTCSNCNAKNGHDQQLLERGAYEWMRKNPSNKEQLWKNYRIGDPEYEHYFLVGNQARYLNSFMVIGILWRKKR